MEADPGSWDSTSEEKEDLKWLPPGAIHEGGYGSQEDEDESRWRREKFHRNRKEVWKWGSRPGEGRGWKTMLAGGEPGRVLKGEPRAG